MFSFPQLPYILRESILEKVNLENRLEFTKINRTFRGYFLNRGPFPKQCDEIHIVFYSSSEAWYFGFNGDSCTFDMKLYTAKTKYLKFFNGFSECRRISIQADSDKGLNKPERYTTQRLLQRIHDLETLKLQPVVYNKALSLLNHLKARIQHLEVVDNHLYRATGSFKDLLLHPNLKDLTKFTGSGRFQDYAPHLAHKNIQLLVHKVQKLPEFWETLDYFLRHEIPSLYPERIVRLDLSTGLIRNLKSTFSRAISLTWFDFLAKRLSGIEEINENSGEAWQIGSFFREHARKSNDRVLDDFRAIRSKILFRKWVSSNRVAEFMMIFMNNPVQQGKSAAYLYVRDIEASAEPE